MKSFLSVLFYFSVTAIGLAQVKVIPGKWEAQKEDLSCWAAALANVSKPDWNARAPKIDETSYWNDYPHAIPSLDCLMYFGSRDYNFGSTSTNQILTWDAIRKVIGYQDARPLLYSFKLDNTASYHAVNIVGYENLVGKRDKIDKWLYVYDPKPNKKGTTYLKNYLAYQLVENPNDNIQGTLYRFVKKGERLQIPITPSPHMMAVKSTGFVNCLKNEDEILEYLKNLFIKVPGGVDLSDGFRQVAGLVKSGLKAVDHPMSLEVFRSVVKFRTGDNAPVSMVTQSESESMILPFATTGSGGLTFRTGVILRKTGPDCWLVDELINLDFMNALRVLKTDLAWTNSIGSVYFPAIKLNFKLTFIVDEDQNRFIEIVDITGRTPPQIYNVDGFKNGGRPELFDKSVFLKKMTGNINFEELSIPRSFLELRQPAGGIIFSEQDYNDLRNTGVKKIFLPSTGN